GSRVQGSGSRVQGSGSRVQGPGSKVQGSGSRVQGSGSRVQGSGSRVQGSGSRVSSGVRTNVVAVGGSSKGPPKVPPPQPLNTHPSTRARASGSGWRVQGRTVIPFGPFGGSHQVDPARRGFDLLVHRRDVRARSLRPDRSLLRVRQASGVGRAWVLWCFVLHSHRKPCPPHS
ncbi:hypothetical protein T484DRAFT_1627978, partial [Baffinella frigidus]